MEFHEQSGSYRVVGIRVTVNGVHLDLIEQLDARYRDAELDGLDHRVDRTFQRIEGTDRGRDAIQSAVQPDRSFRDDAQSPFGADEQTR